MKPVKLKNLRDQEDFVALSQFMPSYWEKYGDSRALGIEGAIEYSTSTGRRYVVYQTKTLTVVVRQ